MVTALSGVVDTSQLYLDIDVSLGWVEGYGNNLRVIPKNEPAAVPTPSVGSFLFKTIAVLVLLLFPELQLLPTQAVDIVLQLLEIGG